MLVPRESPSLRNFATGLYERDLTRLLPEIVRKHMSVVDVGASVGYYSLMASRLVGEQGHVYSFEPDSKGFGYLSWNIKLNELSNIVAVHKAVSDRVGNSSFVPGGFERGFLSMMDTNVPPPERVSTTSLDAFFGDRQWPAVDLIKLDIEGAEALALRGMPGLVVRNQRMILIIECNRLALRRSGTSWAHITYLVREMGFREGRVIERDLKPVGSDVGNSSVIYNVLFER